MRVINSRIENVPIARLIEHPDNPRKGDVDVISESIDVNGFYGTIVAQLQQHDGLHYVLVGNHRLKAARLHGLSELPVAFVDVGDAEAKRIMLADNRTSDIGGYNPQQLADLLQELQATEQGFSGTGYDTGTLETLLDELRESQGGAADDIAAGVQPDAIDDGRGKLREKFIVPPFSVLDARAGYWQDRKRAWIALGIQSELGRGDVMPSGASSVYSGSSEWSGYRGPKRGHRKNFARVFDQDIMRGEYVLPTDQPESSPVWETPEGHRVHTNGLLIGPSDTGNDPTFYVQKQRKEQELGRALTTAEFRDQYYQGPETYQSGTSIFDPVLCELVYRWFTPAGGAVLDPLCGGSVRGVVAAVLGHEYVGIDLRAEQIAANRAQWTTIGQRFPDAREPTWVVGDALDVTNDLALERGTNSFDMVFTCPPYHDLEVYSDNPSDISTMSYEDFIAAWRTIISQSYDLLNDNRFAVVVVGEIRDQHHRGGYKGFVADTIQAFEDHGFIFYNEAILVTAIGSLAIRVGAQFQAGRKLGKTHQNVLVFYKGDVKAIKEHFPEIDQFGDPLETIEAEGDESIPEEIPDDDAV